MNRGHAVANKLLHTFDPDHKVQIATFALFVFVSLKATDDTLNLATIAKPRNCLPDMIAHISDDYAHKEARTIRSAKALVPFTLKRLV